MTNLARRKRVDHCWQDLDNPSSEVAVAPIEMAARMLLATGRKTVHFRWKQRLGQCEKLGRDWHRLFQV